MERFKPDREAQFIDAQEGDRMKPGDMVVLSDYWDHDLVLVLEVNVAKDSCTVLCSDGSKDSFVLSFLKTLEVISCETG